jgi:hypothetical protein
MQISSGRTVPLRMKVSPEYLLMRNLPFCAASLALQLPALPSCSAPKLNSIEMAIGSQSAIMCGVFGAAVASTPVMLRPKLNSMEMAICKQRFTKKTRVKFNRSSKNLLS